MPINSKGNNRILPPNARTVDVAKRTLAHIIPVQNRKYDAAFKVNGYTGVLYTPKRGGLRCLCCTSPEDITPSLSSDGTITKTDMNTLLSEHGFGTKPYATIEANTQSYIEDNSTPTVGFFGITHQPLKNDPLNPEVGGRKIDLPDSPLRIQGSPFDRTGHDIEDPTVTTIVDRSSNGAVSSTVSGYTEIASDIEENKTYKTIDTSLTRSADVGCPICFGSGFTGGYTILNGWRTSLVPFDPEAYHDGTVSVSSSGVEYLINSYITWTVVLPRGCISIDSFTLYAGSTIVRPLSIQIDNSPTPLRHADYILNYCDGRRHTIKINFAEPTVISHLEIQLNQSTTTANFEFPKISHNATPNLQDTTLPVQLILSPLIPNVTVGDIITESTQGKTYIVTDVTDWKTNQYKTLGWEVNARVVQPYELQALLPKRRLIKTQTTPALVQKNMNTNDFRRR